MAVLHLAWRSTNVIQIDIEEGTTLGSILDRIDSAWKIPPNRLTLVIRGLKITKADVQSNRNALLSSFGTINDTMKGTVIGVSIGSEYVVPTRDVGCTSELPAHQESDFDLMPRGYRNIGNTCYLGAVLSLLEHTNALREGIIEYDTSKSNSYAVLCTHIQDLLKSKKRNEAVYPARVFNQLRVTHPHLATLDPNNPGFAIQQDAEETLSALINAFSGTNFLNLMQLEFVDRNGITSTALQLSCYMGVANKGVNFLDEGLRLGLASNQSELRITGLPQVLIIHMVRFDWKEANLVGGTKGGRAKIQRRVEYPKELNLSSFVDSQFEGNSEYELSGVLTHSGRSANFGHYMYFVYDKASNTWFKLDDDKTTNVELELQGGHADGPCPYILVYGRK